MLQMAKRKKYFEFHKASVTQNDVSFDKVTDAAVGPLMMDSGSSCS